MIDQQAILKEMQSLERQRAEALANLHRIDGAYEMCRHLLQKATQPAAEAEGEGENGKR